MPTPSPIIVVMLSTKTDIGVTLARSPMIVSETAMARTPITSGSAAATSAPKASTRMTEGERQERALSPLTVLGDDRADVEVEGGPAGHPSAV